MKKIRHSRSSSPALVALSVILVVLSFLISFSVEARSDEPVEICVRRPSEIAKYVEVAQAVAGFGGLAALEGEWKLTGLVTMFAKAKVELSWTRTGFFVLANGRINSFQFCVNEARPELLTMRVNNPLDPSLAKLVLKPAKPGETLSVATAKTGGKFMKFKRISD